MENELLQQILNKLDSIDARLDNLDSSVKSIRTQQDVHTRFIGAIKYATEETGAKVNNIELTTARIEGKLSELEDFKTETVERFDKIRSI